MSDTSCNCNRCLILSCLKSCPGVKRVRRHLATGIEMFVSNRFGLRALNGLFGRFLAVVIIFGIYFAMIAIGIGSLHSCPIQPFLPFLLILYGTVGVLQNLCDSEKEELYNMFARGQAVLFLFEIIFVIQVYLDNYTDDETTGYETTGYCSKYLYKFTLVHVLMHYFWVALRIFLYVCDVHPHDISYG